MKVRIHPIHPARPAESVLTLLSQWSLVIAGINDMNRPVEKMSGTQQVALLATGAIWTRWCLIIKPKNILLASVNFFLGAVAGYQVVRIYNHERELGYSTGDAILNLVRQKKQEQQAPKIEAAPVAVAEGK